MVDVSLFGGSLGYVRLTVLCLVSLFLVFLLSSLLLDSANGLAGHCSPLSFKDQGNIISKETIGFR